MTTATIDRAELFAGLEGITVKPSGSWLWISGDTYPHREYLKAMGCRWSKKRREWYLTGDGGERDEIAENFTAKASPGYMGAVKITGNKAGLRLHGAELSKAIRNDLRDYIKHPAIKRSHINVSVDSYSMGQHIYVTIKLDRSIWTVGREKYIEAGKKDPYKRIRLNDWISYRDEDGEIVTKLGESLDMTPELIENVLALQYDQFEGGEKFDVNHYHVESPYLTDDCIRLLEDVNRIVCAYRYDDSNSMVDYFDTNFYYSIKIKWF